MITEKKILWDAAEYTYPGAFGFVPNIYTYLHEDAERRPAIVIVPGGGYRLASPTEGEIVAKRFCEAGMQAFVLSYTTNLLGIAPLKEQPIQDLSRAVRYIRKNAEEFHVNPEQLFVCGFSAGAHLTGSLAVHWMDVQDQDETYTQISNRPTGVILSYPVITSGEYAHRDSFTALCGENPTQEELTYHSLEKQVTEQTPPVFLWQTVTDGTVPVENSMLMAQALKKAGVSFEYHLFPEGAHGLSLANEEWATGDLGQPYTMEQITRSLMAVKNGIIPMEPEQKEQFVSAFGYLDPEYAYDPTAPRPASGVPVKEVSVWPDLAIAWMKSIQSKQKV